METYMYLMSGSTEAAPKSYVTSCLRIIRKVSGAFSARYGAFKYSPIRVLTADGERGYGIGYWRTDKKGKNKLCLVTEAQAHDTCKWLEKRNGNGKSCLEWWLVGTDKE